MSGSGGSCVASLILCSTISSSYSSLDPLCYDHQLTGLYLVRQLTINSLLIRQYIQSITSTQPFKISSLTEVTLTQSVNISSLRRLPSMFRRRSIDLPHWWPRRFHRNTGSIHFQQQTWGLLTCFSERFEAFGVTNFNSGKILATTWEDGEGWRRQKQWQSLQR